MVWYRSFVGDTPLDQYRGHHRMRRQQKKQGISGGADEYVDASSCSETSAQILSTSDMIPQKKRKQQARKKQNVQEWMGLDAWRELSRWKDEEHGDQQKYAVWSSMSGACAFSEASKDEQDAYMALRKEALEKVSTIACTSLVEYGRRVLSSADPLVKVELTHKAWRAFCVGKIGVHGPNDGARGHRVQNYDDMGETKPIENDQHVEADEVAGGGQGNGDMCIEACMNMPARPEKPELVPAREIPTLKETSLHRSAYTLHNLAHVELNAIDLAWDTVVRFSPARLPVDFYADFARVADDESRHLGWCLQRMWDLECQYGDMPAHTLLWEGCMVSSKDIRERLAVVPMSQEARGLDAGARLAERLVGWGDTVSAAIVSKISEEEHAHVAVGVYWFNAICRSVGDDSKGVFIQTLTELCPDLLRAPFNHHARSSVGLPRDYYDETLWDDDARTNIEQTRHSRRQQHPSGHGMIDMRNASPRLTPIDFDLLRTRLESFISEEGDMTLMG